MYGYSFELITGPMSCGKTEELLRRIRRSIIAKKKVKVISPDIDTRSKGDYIESRNGLWLDAIKVKHSIQIMSVVKPEDEVIAIDELQFFDSNIVKVISKLMSGGKKVIGTGLELDFKAEPFGSMPELMLENSLQHRFWAERPVLSGLYLLLFVYLSSLRYFSGLKE